MSSDAPIQSDPYLSSKEAGKLLGYTHDYISKLCREGKMAGIQRGRVWFVTEEEARAFQARHEAELEQKKAQLSEKFSAIRQQHESQRVQSVEVEEKPQAYSEPVVAAEIAEAEEEEIVEEETSVPVPSPYVDDQPVQKTIQFAMPKHFVALAALALVLVIPSFFNGTPKSQTKIVQNQPTYSQIFVSNLDEGVKTVVATQADLALQTASAFSFIQYLSDGYWELAVSMTELCEGFYNFLSGISDSYLVIYQMQGEMIYNSFGQIGGMGATVLQGYELVGQSFVVGGKNVVDSYQDIFMVDSYIESLKKN